MKTSNYILIAVFILFMACILTFFITAKQYKGLQADKTKIILPDTINVIIAESNTGLIVNGSDKNLLLWNNKIKGLAIYRISADTLFLKVKDFSPVVFLNHSISILGEKDNALDINNYKANRLTIKKTSGNLMLARNTIDTLQIQAMDSATVYLFDNNQIKYLSANMKNGSTFNYTSNNEIGKMSIESDNQINGH